MQQQGILDPLGKQFNPLTQNEYSDDYRMYAEMWSKLPAYNDRLQIIDQIKQNQVSIVISGTGSGKTVLIPKYVIHTTDYQGKIIITLPKKQATKKAAQFAAKTLDVNLGEHVGYQFKGENKKSDSTQLLYSTDGSVVQMLLRDPAMTDYDAVIIDEAHERKVQIDLLLYLLKQTLERRPNFKLIIMSATVDPKIFTGYFSLFKNTIIELSGQPNFPIELFFEEQDKDYVTQAFDAIQRIIQKSDNKKGDDNIIVFVPVVNDTKKICDMISKHGLVDAAGKKITKMTNQCITVHSGSTDEQIHTIGHPNAEKTRHVIISTNVAESSITLHNIKYVIDTGLEMKSSYDQRGDVKRLDVQMATQAQIIQRRGRAGRLFPGECHHLYSKKKFDSLKPFPDPEILESEPSGFIMNLMGLKSDQSVKDIFLLLSKMVDMPKEQSISNGVTRLMNYQMIDRQTEKVTKIGSLASLSRLQPKEFIMTYYAFQLYCLEEMAILIEIMQNTSGKLTSLIFQGDKRAPLKQLEQDFQKTFKKFINKESDILTFWNICNAFINDKLTDKQLSKLNQDLLKRSIEEAKQEKQQTQNYFMQQGIHGFKESEKVPLEDRLIASTIAHQGYNMISRLKQKYRLSTFVKNPKLFYQSQMINGQLYLSLGTNPTDTQIQLYEHMWNLNQNKQNEQQDSQ